MNAPVRFGRYRVDRQIGSGAFAIVWLAHDEVLDSAVAVKVLADNWVERLDVRERFLTEARILRRADSDRVVAVYDIGELPDGRPYFVMTYADRGTLADRLGAGPFPVVDALRYGAEAAGGIAVLHETGFIHRDLTPANVLLRTGRGGSEQVLVADLGLAKAAAHGSGFTQPVGTPGYMAPEQADPSRGLDLRVDVYSLGALVYHLLTGQPPAIRFAAADVPPPSALRPGIPPVVDAVVMRAMAGNPDDRYPSAKALAVALTAALPEAGANAAPGGANAAPGGAPRDDAPAEEAADEVAGQAPTVEAAAAGEAPVWTDPAHGTGRTGGTAGGRRWAVTVLVAVAIVGLVAVGIWVQRLRPGSVRVADEAGAVRIAVPTGWAGQVQDGDWDLAPFGLAGQHGRGLAVAADLSRWRRPASATPGVFVGVGRGIDPARLMARSVGRECAHEVSTQYERGPLSGQLYRYDSCPGAPMELVEVILRAAPGGDTVYLQVRQEPGSDAASDVLASLVVGASP